MVYESDFYTTRRPYRPAPSYSTYTTSKREIPWEKVPFVPRPCLVPDPVTAFGKKAPKVEMRPIRERKSILSPEERAKIRPKVLVEPPKPYFSPRDLNRQKILAEVKRKEDSLNYQNSMDIVLERVHKVAEVPYLPYKRRIAAESHSIY